MLNLVRSIFFTVGPYDSFSKSGLALPIPAHQQNFAIREYASNFMERIGYAPGTGPKMERVAKAFGEASHWLLKNRNSKNQNRNPPWQTFVLWCWTASHSEYPLDMFIKECKTIYGDLLKYAIFLRDSRGKSARGAVVPRLYLRRLLLPLYVLTPSQ
jgi:hypothetical protein